MQTILVAAISLALFRSIASMPLFESRSDVHSLHERQLLGIDLIADIEGDCSKPSLVELDIAVKKKCNPQPRCRGGNCNNCPNGKCGGNPKCPNGGKCDDCPDGNCNTCPNGNCNTCPNGNCNTCPNGNCGGNTCPNGKCGDGILGGGDAYGNAYEDENGFGANGQAFGFGKNGGVGESYASITDEGVFGGGDGRGL